MNFKEDLFGYRPIGLILFVEQGDRDVSVDEILADRRTMVVKTN